VASSPLNPAQHAAVEYAAGPLIVLAGPGTGKTRVIVHRVAHLIGQRGIAPERVVASTFTVKAAEELRARLAELVTPGIAQRVRAGTLHSLGSGIVRRHADQFGLPTRMSLIDAAMSRRVLRGVVEDLSLFRASRAEGLPALCDRLLATFECLCDRAVLPGAALAHAETMVRGAGDDASRAAAAVFHDTARAYGVWCARRWEQGRLTFADFVLLPVLGMTRTPALRALLRAECGAFVVDEFQDCNAGQIELIRLLAGEGQPDLCVVGDDDQAIYAFRGADERAFQRFQRIWPSCRVLELSENYRSVRRVVSLANSVIERAGEARFHPGKRIVPTREDPKEAHGATIVTLDQEHEDAEAIAAMILLDRARGEGGGAGAPSTAVIARTNSDLDRVAAVLTLEGVAWSRRREASMLDDGGVQDLLAWVEWLLHPGATWAARRVMARPPFSVDPRTVAAWEREHRALAAKARFAEDPSLAPPVFHEWLASILPSRREGPGVDSALSTDTEHRATALRVLALYANLRASALRLNAEEAVDLILQGVGTAHVELLPGRERAKRIAALVAFLRLAREKQRDLEPPGDLGAFWAYFNELRDADPALRHVGVADVADAEDERDAEHRATVLEQSGDAPGADAECVHLLTAHSAKGLEFDTVYVTRVKPQHGFPKTRADEPDFEPPEGLVENLDTRDAKTRKLDEERRLFYVACTRARTRLVLLGAHKGKPSASAVNYLDELLFDGAGVEFTKTSVGDVLRDASALGLGVLARTALEAAGLDFAHRRGAGERIDQVVREARVSASNALERAARADLTAEGLASCVEDLARAARTLGLVARAPGAGEAPAWLATDDALRETARRVAALRAGQAGEHTSELRLKPPTPPLALSYSSIDQYQRCPRCWYLRYVLRLPGTEAGALRVGNIVHAALDRFVKLDAAADAEGAPRLGLHDLLRLGTRAMVDEAGPGAVIDDGEAGTVEAQLRSYFNRFHDARAQTLETERTVEFPYAVDGVAHTFTAKIDRVDLAQDGGYRVIDYKTGQAWAALREPKKDDLQFGVYALALRHAHSEAGPIRGTAEYWLLATGERGVIALADIKEGKVRDAIDAAVRGMLDGEFERKKDCGGACGLF
jgi:DNA helicase-2/ATP-dependent DNA helicase PcrA